jgi:hypothetical protein
VNHIHRGAATDRTHTAARAQETAASELRVYPPPAETVKHAAVSGMPAYLALCKEAESDNAAASGPAWREST